MGNVEKETVREKFNVRCYTRNIEKIIMESISSKNKKYWNKLLSIEKPV